jgi:voltage-gated potassium channel
MGYTRDQLRKHRFVVLLAALLLLFPAVAVAQLIQLAVPRVVSGLLVSVFFSGLVLAGVNAVSETRRAKRIASVLAVPTILAGLASSVIGSPVLTVAGQLFGIAFLGYAVVLIGRHMFDVDRVSFDVICASLCGYLLLGFLWANVYSVVEFAEQDSFAFSHVAGEDESEKAVCFEGAQTAHAVYYSFVTLTTLGYGDITPRSSPARIFAVLEAVLGQIYLAVLVARLVGLHIAQAGRPPPRGAGE